MKQPLKVERLLFIYLTLGFILATVIGTITHEFGHWLFAFLLGHDAYIHYASTTLVYAGKQLSRLDVLLFTLGGPVQTCVTGTTGIVLLFRYRKTFREDKKLSVAQWLIVFLSLFWLRQTTNFTLMMGDFITRGRYSLRGDEIKLSRYLQIPELSIISLTAFIGVCVLTVVVLKLIPFQQWLTFILSGIIGVITGYVLWMELFGKMIIP